MIPPPPTSTLFPYTTLFRSYQFRCLALGQLRLGALVHALERLDVRVDVVELEVRGRPELIRSEEHTSELQSHSDLVCRLLLEKKKKTIRMTNINMSPLS